MPIVKPKLNPKNKDTTLKSIPPKNEAKPSRVNARGSNFSEYDSASLKQLANNLPIKKLGKNKIPTVAINFKEEAREDNRSTKYLDRIRKMVKIKTVNTASEIKHLVSVFLTLSPPKPPKNSSVDKTKATE